MLRQVSGRSHRSKKLRPSQSLQAFLLVAVAVWIVYQLARTYGKRRFVAVEAGGELARRRLGRKGFVDIAAGQAASVDDVVGVGDGNDDGRGADSSDDPLSEAGDAGDEDDQEADEDDGVNGDPDDADDGLATDEEEDEDRDLQSRSGSSEDELKIAHGETQSGLNTSIAPPVNATDTVQDGGAAVLLANATARAADGTALALAGSVLKNISSVDLPSLHARGTAGDVANKLLANIRSPGENQSLQTKNGTADSVSGQAISS